MHGLAKRSFEPSDRQLLCPPHYVLCKLLQVATTSCTLHSSIEQPPTESQSKMASNIDPAPIGHPSSPPQPSVESMSPLGNAAQDSPFPRTTPIIQPDSLSSPKTIASGPEAQPSSDAAISIPLSQQVSNAMGLLNQQETQLNNNIKHAREQITELEVSLVVAKRNLQIAREIQFINADVMRTKRLVNENLQHHLITGHANALQELSYYIGRTDADLEKDATLADAIKPCGKTIKPLTSL